MGTKIHVGGNALPDGVAMRSQHFMSTARRLTDGSIEVKVEPVPESPSTNWFSTKLFLRGAAAFVLMFAFMFKSFGRQRILVVFAGMIVLTILTAYAFNAALIGVAATGATSVADSSLFASIINVAINILMLCLLVVHPKIRRLLRYHGAEHQCVWAAESGADITPEVARRFPIQHPRCGTGVFALYLLGATAIGAFLPPMTLLLSIGVNFIMMVVLFSIIYEIVKLAESELWGYLARPFLLPGLWLQLLSVWRPDVQHLEVACAATNAVIKAEEEFARA